MKKDFDLQLAWILLGLLIALSICIYGYVHAVTGGTEWAI